jgi:hypothetical protein
MLVDDRQASTSNSYTGMSFAAIESSGINMNFILYFIHLLSFNIYISMASYYK